MRNKIIAGNWKMNKNIDDAQSLIKSLLKIEVMEGRQIIVFPPQLYISEFSKYNKPNFSIGAQNCHPRSSGAFTGEISASMLKSVNIQYCLVGHSECRKYFGDTDYSCLDKVKSLLDAGITPILCIGEDLETRNDNQHLQHIIHQLSVVFSAIPENEATKIIIAYEPIWAIGTGNGASIKEVKEMHKFIHNTIKRGFNKSIDGQIRILYGGSVNENNVKDLLELDDVDGVLVGSASLEFDTFKKIIQTI